MGASRLVSINQGFVDYISPGFLGTAAVTDMAVWNDQVIQAPRMVGGQVATYLAVTDDGLSGKILWGLGELRFSTHQSRFILSATLSSEDAQGGITRHTVSFPAEDEVNWIPD
jgi:hypothetical protein